MSSEVEPEGGSSTVVEGVGDEVVMVGGTALALLATLLAVVIVSGARRRPHNIHPDVLDPVESARREMGVGGGEGRGEVGGSAEVEHCPICLGELTYAVDTNCGHSFCAQCLLTYWQHDQWPRPARCAVCRRPVTLLLPSRSLLSVEAQPIWRQVSDYNQRMSGQPRPLIHYLYDVPTLLRHLWRDLFTVQGLVMIHKAHILLILFFLLLYFLSPFDIIPEAVVGVLGLVDDVLIVAGALVYITLIYRAHIANTGID